MKELRIKKDLIEGLPSVFTGLKEVSKKDKILLLTVGIEGMCETSAPVRLRVMRDILNLDKENGTKIKTHCTNGDVIVSAIKTSVNNIESIIFSIEICEQKDTPSVTSHIEKQDFEKFERFLDEFERECEAI